MRRSLTKKYIRMVSLDEATPLMAYLGDGADARDFHIEGDILPLRCAMYGSIECFLSILRARPDIAEDIAALSDGNGERCVDWIAGCANAAQAREIMTLAPIASSSPGPNGAWPLARALAMGRWDAARLWLDANPQSATLKSSSDRGALHLVAEPSYEFNASDDGSVWTEPPAALVARLIELGASPSVRNAKKYSALARAISRGHQPTFDAMLSAIPDHAIGTVLDKADQNFSALHEAAWGGRPEMIKALLERGADVSELTAKGFDALHLAIRQGGFAAAQALLDAGLVPDGHKSRTTSCACSAMSSEDPESWLAWLSERGVNLSARDDHGSHWAELAWERLSLERATHAWDALGSAVPQRSPLSMLGPLERAARSELGAVEKVEALLARGMLPARIDLGPAVAQGITELRAQLGHLDGRHFHSTTFGIHKHVELSAMWATFPDTNLLTLTPSSTTGFDDDALANLNFHSANFSDPTSAARTRPSLLAYAARLGKPDLIQALARWDAKHSWFGLADYVSAWNEALRSDASLPTLRCLSALLTQRGAELWTDSETRLAIDKLGPSKARELSGHPPSAGDALTSQMKQPDSRLDHIFLINESLLSVNSAHFLADKSYPISNAEALQFPWRIAARSEHAGAIKALLPLDVSWPATACLHTALACASHGKADLTLWVASRVKKIAKDAAPDSPWGREPERAIELWGAQSLHELALARSSFPDSAFKHGGSMDPGQAPSALLAFLLEAEQARACVSLIELGLPAPQHFQNLSRALAKNAEAATAIGKGNEMLEDIRSLIDAMRARQDYRQLIASEPFSSESLLANSPDPALFDSLLLAGAQTGSGPDNAFVALCSRFSGRLSPAFAERLAQGSRDVAPDVPLAVAAALAGMKSHPSRDSMDFSITHASRLRVTRAARGVDAQGWIDTFTRGICPVGKAISAGNVEMGLTLAESAPSGYAALAGKSWTALWIGARLPVLAKALNQSKRLHSTDADNHSSANALASMAEEIRRLDALGSHFGAAPELELQQALLGLERATLKAAPLTWLLRQGWRPQGQVDSSSWDYQLRARIRSQFSDDQPLPSSVPLLCAAFPYEYDTDRIIELCLAWSEAGLNDSIVSPSGAVVCAHSILPPHQVSALESRLLSETLGIQKTEPSPKIRSRL